MARDKENTRKKEERCTERKSSKDKELDARGSKEKQAVGNNVSLFLLSAFFLADHHNFDQSTYSVVPVIAFNLLLIANQ